MAKRISIGELAAKVTADAKPFLEGIKQAQTAAKTGTNDIDRQFAALKRKLMSKWNFSSIGGQLARGLGIGSGLQAAQMIAEKFTNHFKEAAEAAKSIEESTAKQLEYTEKLIRLRWTPDQFIAAKKSEVDRLQREYEDSKKPKITTKAMGGMIDIRPTEVPRTFDDEVKTNELAAQWARAALELKQLELDKEQKDLDAKRKQQDDDRARAIARNAEGLRIQEEAQKDATAAQKEANDEAERARKETDDLIESYLRLQDPLREYKQDLEKLQKIQEASPSLKVAQGIDAVTAAMEKARAKWIDDELTNFFGDLDKQSEANMKKFEKLRTAGEELKDSLNQMWNSVSDRAGQAFADMVLTGEAAFSDLVNIVARSVIEMVARLAIINPLLNALFGGMSGFGMMPAFWGAGAGAAPVAVRAALAGGGAVAAGQTYLVGEEGPELFRAPSAGTIVPNHEIASTGGRGDSFAFTYNIGAGVTRDQLMPILRQHEQNTIAKIVDARRRGHE